jgi:hypothetical protein
MFYWIYNVPSFFVWGLFVIVFVGVCWLGTIFLRPSVERRLNQEGRLNEIMGDFLQYFGVIYGLLLGLLAVSTYQNHSDTERAVGAEASSLAALYQDVSAYPEPFRTDLRALIKEDTRYSIEVAWPVQRIGFVPVGGVQRASAIHRRLSSFQPQTKEQELLHEAALRQFNTYFENKRTRLYGVTASIPGVMWLTVGVGAAINMLLIWLFRLNLSVHLLLGGLISFFTATMICLIVLLDNPYRGELGVPPEAFQLIYEQLMNNPK